jgi:hypothetical protein
MLVNLVQRTSQLFLPRLELGTNSWLPLELYADERN